MTYYVNIEGIVTPAEVRKEELATEYLAICERLKYHQQQIWKLETELGVVLKEIHKLPKETLD